MEIGDNIIDSRDIITRMEELQDELNGLESAVDTAEDEEDKVVAQDDLDNFKRSFEYDELGTLIEVNDEGERYVTDWKHGEALIRDDYFEDYAQELAEDIGSVNRDAPWPQCHIDWEAAANALKMDYTTINVGGTDYYVRG